MTAGFSKSEHLQLAKSILGVSLPGRHAAGAERLSNSSAVPESQVANIISVYM